MTDAIKFHPLADIFPLMEGEEFNQLVADIEANGQHARIVLKDGMILDGRNRYRACLAAGIEPSFACKEYSDQVTDPLAYVISANIRRRHLTRKQKHDALVKLVAAQAEKADRVLAKQAGVSHPTIAKARQAAEATGKALPVDKRVGADGKARKQPARKGWSKERYKRHRAAKKTDAEQEEADKKECIALWRKVQQAEAEKEAKLAAADTDAADREADEFVKHLASKLIEQLDSDTVHALHKLLRDDKYCPVNADAYFLMECLERGLGLDGNDADAEASAEAMKARFAAEEVTSS